MKVDVGIVGAGLAGLACARRLGELGVACAVFDAADRVGGRVVTDEVEGFRLDRGFQVLLDSYPEARRVLDLEALRTGTFAPGALVRQGARSWRVVDPWRSPLSGIGTLRAPFVTLGDGLRMASLRRGALRGGERDERSAADMLRAHGFSEPLRASFFLPFFGGVTLDPDLAVPAWYLKRLFAWFAKGSAVLPAGGMQAIPEQMAAALPPSTVHLGERATSASGGAVEFESGTRIECGAVVIATDASAAGRLLGYASEPEWLGTTTVYYASERSPVGEPILVLNGEGRGAGPVNHLCVLSDAQPSYAPAGASLISVSVLGVPPEGDEQVDAGVRAQLARWYGDDVRGWRLLRVDRIPRALPRMTATRPEAAANGVFVCGDHVATPSIQGSLESGRHTAEAVHSALLAAAR